jgi:hypothetical protein
MKQVLGAEMVGGAVEEEELDSSVVSLAVGVLMEPE